MGLHYTLNIVIALWKAASRVGIHIKFIVTLKFPISETNLGMSLRQEGTLYTLRIVIISQNLISVF